MQIYASYKEAFQVCMERQTYSVAHLYHLQKNMRIDTSGCYKIFFSLSGSKKFHIDDYTYEVNANSLFFVNPREWHYFSHFDETLEHERYVLFIYPDYIKNCSSAATDLTDCFAATAAARHSLCMTAKEKDRCLYFLHKLTRPQEYGIDLLDYALFLEIMVFLNKLALDHRSDAPAPTEAVTLHNRVIADILAYLDTHVTEELSINGLAGQFFLSPSYLCKAFKSTTGTTIHKYITAKRITVAKDYLSEGYPIIEVSAMCGYNDYNAFLRAFTRETGISPKKYAKFVL